MIKWLSDPRWKNFHLCIYKSDILNVGFGIVSEDIASAASMEVLRDYYCQLQLAHVFHNPVIIFPIQQPAVLGAPLFNAAPNTPVLYNIPPSAYTDLPTAIEDAPFLVSDKAIKEIENFQGIMGSIYESLTALQTEKGLVVVGLYDPE